MSYSISINPLFEHRMRFQNQSPRSINNIQIFFRATNRMFRPSSKVLNYYCRQPKLPALSEPLSAG